MFDSSDIGIDLGTSTTLVCVPGRGIVLREPSVVAVERVTGRLLAVGEEARRLMGRAPGGMVVIRPLRDGVISNFDITARMLAYFFKKAVGRRRLFKPRAVICVPSGVTEAERRCVIEASVEAGARYTYLIEEPLAAAIGAGLDVMQDKGCMVLDIGGGTTDIAVISQGCVVISDSIRLAGDKLDEALMRYMKQKHNLHIGERAAEDIKIAYGRAHIEKEQRIVEIRGRSTVTGLPENLPIGTNELVDALGEPLRAIIERVRGLLMRTPPDLSRDIAESGIVITGGGALLNGLDRYVSEQCGMPCRAALDPVDCVAIGTGRVLEDLRRYNVAVRDYRRGEYFEA
ncbi:MAG: rod shape-determining protein [Clostridia bacterium]|nr:rod shape-determining protein [Clostridia bacterium]